MAILLIFFTEQKSVPYFFFRVAKTLSRVCLCRASVSGVLPVEIEKLLYVILTTTTKQLNHRHTFINALPKNSCFLIYLLCVLRSLSPRLKYSRNALCINALPYAPYFRQRFAPFFRHRRRSQGYLKSRHRLLA